MTTDPTARDLLVAVCFEAWEVPIGEATRHYVDAIAATPSGAELIRRADEPHVAEGLTVEALATVRASLQREYDGQRATDNAPYYANGVMYALMVIDKYASLPAPRPPEPDRTAALVALSKAMHGADFTAEQVMVRLRSNGFVLTRGVTTSECTPTPPTSEDTP